MLMKSKSLLLVAVAGCCFLTGLVKHTAAQDSEKTAELLAEARQYLGQEDYEQAAETLAELVKLDPKNGLAWQLHGYALHVQGKLDAAIKSHSKAASFDQTKGIALYNLGCAYSLKKEKEKAVAYLKKAVRADFRQLEFFETDSDLDNIRKEKAFKELLTIVKNGDELPKEDDDKDKKKKDKFRVKALVGEWQVVAGERSGEKIDSSRLPPSIKITAKELTIPTGDDNPFKFAFKVDASKTPVAIDFKITGGPVPQGNALGILKLEKGKATLCYDSAGLNRPEKFETEDGDGRFLFKMVKKEKKKVEKIAEEKADKEDGASEKEADQEDK